MSAPAYVQRFVRVARVLAILPNHPDGIRLDELAAQLGATQDEVRDEITAYHAAEVTVDQLAGGYHEPVIEFAAGPVLMDGGEEVDVDPARAEYVRLRDVRPASDVGTRLLSFGQLAAVAQAGRQLLAMEPDNDVLVSALDVVADTVLFGRVPGDPPAPAGAARPLRQAAAERRRVRITYAPTWKAGVVERVIEPYRVVHTRHGWEIDAGVVDRNGDVSTFLASGILSFELLDERFVRPTGIERKIERSHQAQAVSLVVPHAARWAVEMHAESAEVVDEDVDFVKIRAEVLPPVGPRLGLVLLMAGPDAFVVEPASLQHAGRDLARSLLAHHGGGG